MTINVQYRSSASEIFPDEIWQEIASYTAHESYVNLKSTCKNLTAIFKKYMPYSHEWVEHLAYNGSIKFLKYDVYRYNSVALAKYLARSPEKKLQVINEFYLTPFLIKRITHELQGFVNLPTKDLPSQISLEKRQDKWDTSTFWCGTSQERIGSYSYFFQHGFSYDELNADFQKDFDVLQRLFQKSPGWFKHLPKELKQNTFFISGWLKASLGEIFSYLPKTVQKEQKIVNEAVRQDINNLNLVTQPFKQDVDVAVMILLNKTFGVAHVQESYQRDPEFMLTAFKKATHEQIRDLLLNIDPMFRHDINFMKKVFEISPESLEVAGENVRCNLNFIFECCQKKPQALSYASGMLQANRLIISALISKIPACFAYATNFQADKFIAFTAVKSNGLLLRNVHKSLQNDPDIVTAAVHQNTYARQYVGEQIRKNALFMWTLECLKAPRDFLIKKHCLTGKDGNPC